MAVNLPKLPEVEKLSTNITRILGGNPSKFTLQGSNTYLLGAGSKRMLLDTGEGRPSWSTALSDTLESENTTVFRILLSHWHHDHVGGVKDVLKICKESIPEQHKNNPSLNPDGLLNISDVIDISEGSTFKDPSGSSFEVTAVHTPGHTKDHMCFLVTNSDDQSEIGSLFTGDNVLGHGTAVFEDLATYLNTLGKMKDLVSSKKVKAYPGHGAVIDDAAAKIQDYMDHRKMREEEALNVLRYGTTTPPPSQPSSEGAAGDAQAVVGKEVVIGKEWESMEMVKVIYRHYPDNLWQPAEGGLLMVLNKLKGEGRVIQTEGGKWRVTEKAAL